MYINSIDASNLQYYNIAQKDKIELCKIHKLYNIPRAQHIYIKAHNHDTNMIKCLPPKSVIKRNLVDRYLTKDMLINVDIDEREDSILKSQFKIIDISGEEEANIIDSNAISGSSEKFLDLHLFKFVQTSVIHFIEPIDPYSYSLDGSSSVNSMTMLNDVIYDDLKLKLEFLFIKLLLFKMIEYIF